MKPGRFSKDRRIGDTVTVPIPGTKQTITYHRTWVYAEHPKDKRDCTNGQKGECFLITDSRITTCPHCGVLLKNVRFATSEDIIDMMDSPLQKEKSRRRAEALLKKSKLRAIG